MSSWKERTRSEKGESVQVVGYINRAINALIAPRMSRYINVMQNSKIKEKKYIQVLMAHGHKKTLEVPQF